MKLPSKLLALMAGWLALMGAGSYMHATSPQRPSSALPAAASSQRALLTQYCITCHNENLRAKGTVPVSFEGLDLSRVSAHAEVWEKVVRKLRGGVMPPAGMPRPDKATLEAFAGWFEAELDRAAAAAPNPGRSDAIHRLNRAEYQNATRDLLDIEVDVAALLPPDDASYGFDNIAGVLRVSPTLLERYLVAAKKISRAAVGTPPRAANFDVFRVPDDLPQDDRLEGLPFGTRGGTLIRYHFPTDGQYAVRVKLARGLATALQDIPNFNVPQQVEVSLDGVPLRVFTLEASKPRPRPMPVGNDGQAPRGDNDGQASRGDNDSQTPRRPGTPQDPDDDAQRRRPAPRTDLDATWEVRFETQAGPREIAVTFLNRTPALLETLIEPYLHPYPASSPNQWGSRKGAYVSSVEVSGPFSVAGISETPSRRRIFACRPTTSADEPACAKTILSTLTRRAYRRPVTDAEVQLLLDTYEEGRGESGFEAGIELALRQVLVSPNFLFRTKMDRAVGSQGTYRISDLELASSLSFFLWSSIPDDQLLELATRGKLKEPAVLEQQVRRMLADERSQALIENFTGQWLLLRNVPAIRPDPFKDPDFDESLRRAMNRETELFFESIMREDRSVVELLASDYTFLNERLARHYGIPGVSGTHFRRVALSEGTMRGGLLGHASILAATSHANRTSPVVRGKWILEHILGTPPPAPPSDVPPLAEKPSGTQTRTMRQRMEEHRTNAACASCHSMMDPLGFALEHFDQAGRWRPVEESFDSRVAAFTPLVTSGAAPDGTKFDGAVQLRDVLLSRSTGFVTTLTENLLTYAVGRGVEYYDMPAIRAIVRDAARQDYRFSSVVLGIVNSVPFRMRRAAVESTTVASGASR